MDIIHIILGLIITGLAVGLTISVIKLSNVKTVIDEKMCGANTTFNKLKQECEAPAPGSTIKCETSDMVTVVDGKCKPAISQICSLNENLTVGSNGIKCVAKPGKAICAEDKCNAAPCTPCTPCNPLPSDPADPAPSSPDSSEPLKPVAIAAIVLAVISGIVAVAFRARAGGVPSFRRTIPSPIIGGAAAGPQDSLVGRTGVINELTNPSTTLARPAPSLAPSIARPTSLLSV